MRRLLGVAVLILLLAGCATTDSGRSPVEGKKVAYVLNMARSDIFTDAAAGAVDTARALGMRCTVYFTGGDDALFITYVRSLAAEGYDGLFLSHGGRDYSYSLISYVRLLYPQLSIVTFDTELIGPDGKRETIDGVTQFFQDDRELATILLDYIIEEIADESPARVLKLWVPDYIAAFDRRNEGYEAYEDAGLIDTVAVVSPSTEIDPELASYRAMKEALEGIDEDDIDAIWASYDAYGRGCYRALMESGKDIPLVSVDISEGDMALMGEDGSLWLASACTDFRANGEQGMRLLALEMADEYERIPSGWIEMGASLITRDDLPGEGESLSDTAPSTYGDPDELVTSPWIRDAIGY